MTEKQKARQPSSKTLPKASTGIQGLDEITGGGLPNGRPTLVSGGAGSGKTLFGLEFLVRGATQYNEPGVCSSFEETIPDLTQNAASLGFDLDRLVAEMEAPQRWALGPHSTRRFLLRKFPFTLIYRERPTGAIQIVALAHTSRKPGYWKHRLSVDEP